MLGGDFNVAPADVDVWDPRACHGGTHVSPPEREAFATPLPAGDWSTPIACTTPSRGRYTWWDYRAGNFHKNFGMRIDHLLVDAAGRERARCGRRSIARRARASRSRPITRRW